MEHRRTEISIGSPVSSLCWHGDALVDWAGGNREIDLHRGRQEVRVGWGYRFNDAIQSPSGRFAVILERQGTKALLLDQGKLLRELNRSYYCAGAYEYPIAFLVHPDGRELLVHCPEDYNRLEIEDAVSGERLTRRTDRTPGDFFHSRLAVSHDHQRLLSAGWVWHPFQSVLVWSVADVLADARILDSIENPAGAQKCEVCDALFMGTDHLLLSSNSDADDWGEGKCPLRAGTLGVFDLRTREFEHVIPVEETVGVMLWLGNDHVLGFHETPKVFNIRTGRVELGWPDISVGSRSGCLGFRDDDDSLPPLAIDPVRRRFAVASKDRITVIEFAAPEMAQAGSR